LPVDDALVDDKHRFGRQQHAQDFALIDSRPSISRRKGSAPRRTLQAPPPPDRRPRRVAATVVPPTYKASRRTSVKPLFILDRPYPFSFSLSSTLHQFLSPANSMAPSIESTPESVA
jgi:hypothetical protein